MAILIGYNLIDPAWTGSNVDGSFPATNLIEYENLMWQARTLTTAESSFVGDMSAAKALKLVFLNDINFTTFYLEGNATDAWGAPSFLHGPYTAVRNGLTNRYQAAIDIRTLAFNYRYIRLRVPNQATTDGAAYFRLGGIAVTDTVIEPATNISYGSKDQAAQAVSVQKYKSGGRQVTILGDNLIWQKTLEWGRYPKTDAAAIKTLMALPIGLPLIYAENNGDSSEGYLCAKGESPIVMTNSSARYVNIGSVDLIELV